MSDPGGDHTRLRRYPRLPVWVVEDHQEVSRQQAPPSHDRRDSNPGDLQSLDQHLTLAARLSPANESFCCVMRGLAKNVHLRL